MFLKVTILIQEAFDNKIIDENKFYCALKDHRKHDEGKAQPIVGYSNVMSENVMSVVQTLLMYLQTKYKKRLSHY